MRHVVTSAALGLFLVAGATTGQAGTLWFGNDYGGTDYHTTTTGTVLGTINESLTGVAWDGTTLFVSDRVGDVERKTLAGAPLPGGFTVAPPAGSATGEDMAWDPRIGRLFKLYHYLPAIQSFTTSGGSVASFALPTSDPLLGTIGALGVAYDSLRNQLDISFCQAGCGAIGGVVEAFDPTTLAPIGVLFRSSTSYLGGLGYDPATDTLWVAGFDGSGNYVANVTQNGTVLSQFSTAGFSGLGFGDGMEFIPAPEPGSLALLGAGLASLGLFRRSRG